MKIMILFITLFMALFSQSAHRDLSFKLGKWKWEAKGLVKAGDPKIYQGLGYSHVYYANDSLALIDEHKIVWENGINYHAITYRTYDEKSKSWLVVWAQAKSLNTRKIIGKWEADKFVETNSGKDQFGTWTDRLEIYDIKKNSHKVKLIRRYESGYSLILLEYKASKIDI